MGEKGKNELQAGIGRVQNLMLLVLSNCILRKNLKINYLNVCISKKPLLKRLQGIYLFDFFKKQSRVNI